MFRYLFSVISFLFIIISPCVANIASSEYVNEMRDNIQAKIDKKADNANYTQNMVLQTDNSGNVIATTVGTDLFADGAIETMHLTDGAVTNADLAGMIDIKKLNLGTLPTSGKHMMIWNATTNEYVFERYATSILPAEYTQLEYIETDGKAKIVVKLANILSSESDFEVKYYIPGEIDNSKAIFGAYYGQEQGGARLSLFAHAQGSYDGLWTDSSIVYFNGVIPGWRTITLNGNSLSDGASTKDIIRGPETSFSSFGVFAVQSSDYQSINGTRIAYLKIDNSMSLIPAKRNSDGVIGMYDTVTKTFFTNSGTGSFIAGPEIE